MKKHPALLALLSSICILFAFGCAKSQSKGVAAGWTANLNEAVDRKAPKWKSVGDADIDGLGEYIFTYVDGTRTRIQQVADKLTHETEYTQFMDSINDSNVSREEGLQQLRDQGEGEKVEKILTGEKAVLEDVTAAESFFKKLITDAQWIKAPIRVASIKDKLSNDDAIGYVTKVKLLKSIPKLLGGIEYVASSGSAISALKNNIKADVAEAEKKSSLNN
jgi:hypothetical protein